MPPLINTGQGPTRFAAPLGLAPRRNPDIAFSRMLDALQREQALKFRADQQEANRRQRSGLALQRQIGDAFSDAQRIGADQQRVQAIGERQQALENLQTQNDLQVNADKFYRKNYGIGLKQAQFQAEQAGMPLEEYNHVLNGEEFILPPENSAAIDVIDQQLMAIDLDENLGPEDSLNQVLKLNEKRFELGKKQWRRPKTKPMTRQGLMDAGRLIDNGDGTFFIGNPNSQGVLEWKFGQPKEKRAGDGPVPLPGGGTASSKFVDVKAVDGARDAALKEMTDRANTGDPTEKATVNTVPRGKDLQDLTLLRLYEDNITFKRQADQEVSSILSGTSPLSDDQVQSLSRYVRIIKAKAGRRGGKANQEETRTLNAIFNRLAAHKKLMELSQ